jgi:hypothetical protein
VAEHDWPSIAAYCEHLVEMCRDETWEKVASRLSRFFRWEFEDYVQAGDSSLLKNGLTGMIC